MSKTTTQKGVVQENGSSQLELGLLTEMDAENVFLDRWTEEDTPEESSEKPEVKPESEEPTEEVETEDESTEDTEESEEDDTDPEENAEEDTDDDAEEESEEGEEDEEKSEAKKTLDDDAEVEVKVDGAVKKVSVKELTRLYGQEAALTRKSQEVAAKRKEVEVVEQKLAVSYEKLLNKAKEKWEPYSKIDMLVASKQLDADQFAALRQEAQAAYEEFRFVSEEADGFVKQAEAQRQEQLKVQAQEAVKVLKEAIPTWNSNLYDNIREYAITLGMDPEVINNLVDPVALQIIHKARLFDESKKVATKKKVLIPKKVIKSKASTTTKDFKPDNSKKLIEKARQSSDPDDISDLFLSRWQDE
jgi:hypothetical protein